MAYSLRVNMSVHRGRRVVVRVEFRFAPGPTWGPTSS